MGTLKSKCGGWAAALVAALAISGCGGGSEGAPARPARLAAAAAPSLVDVDTLLDWGEATYPMLFPRSNRVLTKASPGYVYYYRDYPAIGNFLGVSGQDVYVQGPTFGAGVRTVGTIAHYECDALPEACWPGASTEPMARLDIGWVSYGVTLPSRAYVIRNQQDWIAVWQQLYGPASVAPAVDFNSNIVVGGTDGWGGGCGGFGPQRILRQGGDLRVLWGSAWTPPMTACPAIISPRVAFVSVAQPVTNVQFVQLRACWNPVPTAGRVDPDLHTLLPDAPDYIITFKAGVDGTSEIARLQAVYGIAAMAASARGFAANLPPAVLAQMRCESAIKYIDHNKIGVPATANAEQ